MKVLDHNTVVIFSSSELKEVLEGDNIYSYIYFGDNITLEEGITTNKNKIVIDGTYLDNRYTYNINNSDSTYVITVGLETENIIIKNLDIECCNVYGVVYCPASLDYKNVSVEYININFNGVQMVYNPYGGLKIFDCVVTIKNTNEIVAQEVAEAAMIDIGGNTTITSDSADYALFTYLGNISYAYFKVLPNSMVNLKSENNEFMRGTYNLDFKILHDANVNLITANGFAAFTIHGVKNVLIDKRASFTFIENKHQRIPMWTIYGNLTVNEGASLLLINTYSNTPSDNYNIHFKGSSCKIILNNPKSVIIYTPNSNVLYTNNLLEFIFSISRINLWNNSTVFSLAGDINNLPDYSWHKDDGLIEISGNFNKTETAITSHNFTDEEISKLPDISNFTFQSKKQFSIGNEVMNIHPITIDSQKISGHTLPFADVLIKYNSSQFNISAADDGLFEFEITDSILDNTQIEFISCVAGSFIYSTRFIVTPHLGELTIMEASSNIRFSLIPVSNNPIILPKAYQNDLKVVDSRINGSDWKLYASIAQAMKSLNGFELSEALVFKKFDDEIVTLSEEPIIIYDGNNNQGKVIVHNLTWSNEKGILLNLNDNALEANEDYSVNILWYVEE